MARYSNQIVTKDIIELNDGEMNYLGHDLKLIGCTINIRAKSKNVIISKVEFINCTIIAKNLKNFDWSWVKMTNCFFAGTFYENNFGDSLIEKEYSTIIENCDFSHAKIDFARFFQIDMNLIKLPVVPYTTIINPKKFALDNLHITKNKDLLFILDYLSTQRDTLSAYTLDTSNLLKKYDIDESELRSFVNAIESSNKLVNLKAF